MKGGRFLPATSVMLGFHRTKAPHPSPGTMYLILTPLPIVSVSPESVATTFALAPEMAPPIPGCCSDLRKASSVLSVGMAHCCHDGTDISMMTARSGYMRQEAAMVFSSIWPIGLELMLFRALFAAVANSAFPSSAM